MPASRTSLLAAAALLSATLTILSAPLSVPALAFIFKPLTTLLVIAHAWPRGRELPAVRHAVLAGLLLSLLGDVALLWPESGFLAGLLSFLLAHLAYLFAFTRVRPLASWWPAFAAYALLAGGILAALWPGVPAALRAPVAVYVVCLAAMAAQAAVLGWRARGTATAQRSALLALGGALFVASDALLATNRFASALPWSGLWILSTYWAAQWCIASWLAPAARARAHMPLNSPV
jgi:uncharacterized membrane protein YhhN